MSAIDDDTPRIPREQSISGAGCALLIVAAASAAVSAYALATLFSWILGG